MQVTPYLMLDGHADEAIDFYKKKLGATVKMLMRFKEAPDQTNCAPGSAEKVMHACIAIGDSNVMLSDGNNTGKPEFKGVSLTLGAKSEDEAEKMFTGLGDGGQVQMPMAKTFFAKRFGMVADKFGVNWMIIAEERMQPTQPALKPAARHGGSAMLDKSKTLTPAAELAQNCKVRFPNESDDYRRARTALLAEEIELRRHIERVAEMRRALPPGGEVKKNYQFIGEAGPVDFAGLFGDKQALVIYTYMFGPQREKPCPMCTSLLSAWDGEAHDITQNVALAITARSSIDRLMEFKWERSWRRLKLYSDTSGDFSRDFHAVTPEGGDNAGLHVFTRRDGAIRHFWSGEMDGGTADPGQDPRGAPDLMPLWTVLDTTPEGRRPDWYPKLDYRR